MTTNILGTATVIASVKTLHARVEVLREVDERFVEVRVISGIGGWSRPGKVFCAGKSLLLDFVPAVPEVEPAPAVEVEPARPITEPMDAEDYMTVLVERQEQWKRAHPQARVFPLLEWFILAGEEDLVRLPETEPAAKPVRTPRVYRSAASLREERDALAARMERLAGMDGTPDRAAANLSPHARSRVARTAGRRRFERMDRDLAAYAELQRRVDALNGRIANAEARRADGKS
jgi:hypothetical protein